jgi:hypothetical protein
VVESLNRALSNANHTHSSTVNQSFQSQSDAVSIKLVEQVLAATLF